MSSPAPWFSHDGGQFDGAEPLFYDAAAFDWAVRVEAEWRGVRDELAALLNDRGARLLPYPNQALSDAPERWTTFALLFWLHELRHNIARCPFTWQLLKDIPGLSSVSFSLMAPGTAIKAHRGDTNAIMRCHLGLDIPAPAPQCALQVGDAVRGWQEGAFTMFCDAHEHSAWNHTQAHRYILIIDVMRPPFVARRAAIARRVVAAVLCDLCCQRLAWLWPARRMVFGLLHSRRLAGRFLNRITR